MAWPAGTLVEVRVHYTVNLQKCMNVFHYNPVGDSVGFTETELTEAFALANAGDVATKWAGEFKNVLCNDVFITKQSVQMVYPVRWRSFEVVSAAGGIRAGNTRAQNVQASVTKLGPKADRHNQGGMRIGGVSHDDYSTGLLTGAYKAALNTLVAFLATDLQDGITPASYEPVIANKIRIVVDGKPKYIYSGHSLIASWIVENEIRTQRSRTVGRGE